MDNDNDYEMFMDNKISIADEQLFDALKEDNIPEYNLQNKLMNNYADENMFNINNNEVDNEIFNNSKNVCYNKNNITGICNNNMNEDVDSNVYSNNDIHVNSACTYENELPDNYAYDNTLHRSRTDTNKNNNSYLFQNKLHTDFNVIKTNSIHNEVIYVNITYILLFLNDNLCFSIEYFNLFISLHIINVI